MQPASDRAMHLAHGRPFARPGWERDIAVGRRASPHLPYFHPPKFEPDALSCDGRLLLDKIGQRQNLGKLRDQEVSRRRSLIQVALVKFKRALRPVEEIVGVPLTVESLAVEQFEYGEDFSDVDVAGPTLVIRDGSCAGFSV